MIALEVETRKREEVVDISEIVKEKLKELNIEQGLLLIFVPHTTCAIALNEGYDPGLKLDMLEKLRALVPKGAGYRHDRIDSNAHAHLRSLLLQHSVLVPIKDGELVLGTWQSLLLFEFDGPRKRKLILIPLHIG